MATSSSGSRPTGPGQYCIDSPAFDPATQTASNSVLDEAVSHLDANDLRLAISSYFCLDAEADSYTYHAQTAVTLAQAQDALALGGAYGLHAWYRMPIQKTDGTSGGGSDASSASSAANSTTDVLSQLRVPSLRKDIVPHPPPPRGDIEAYTSIFLPNTTVPAGLRGLVANARRGSLREVVAAHLHSKRYLHPALESRLSIPKAGKKALAGRSVQQNPYLAFWAWTCLSLEWCGPAGILSQQAASTIAVRGHPALPVLMHHFGCAVPSHECLSVLRIIADGRPVVDAGSGGGYWSFMLRAYGVAVQPVDNGQSIWRVRWVHDTVTSDAAQWMRRQGGVKDSVLLVVYPIVGGGLAGGAEGSFMRGLLDAYKGDTVVVAGTQNKNGYTAFKDVTMDEYMAQERKEWTRVVQIALPSFAGKDEALYVFQRGERAPKESANPGAVGQVET